MDVDTLELLGFFEVLKLIQGFAQTGEGAELVGALRPSSERKTVSSRSVLVPELIALRREVPRFDLAEAGELPVIIQQLRVGGAVLEPGHFQQLASGIRLCGQITAIARDQEREFLLRAFIPFRDLRPLAGEIDAKIEPDGSIPDSADPELRRIRKKRALHQRKLEERLEGYLKGRASKHLIGEPFITRRNERYVIPVRTEEQSKVPGVVHATSSSGATVFLEPLDVVSLNNTLLQTELEELRRLGEILALLSERARSSLALLESMVAELIQLDFCQAVSEFAIRYRCCFGGHSDDQGLRLDSARHPLLERSEDEVVPLTLHLPSHQRMLVISGPNAGGKTVALKTIGLLAAMAQAGLPVPAERADFPCFRSIMADIGDHQSIDRHLSTFSARLLRIADILKRVDNPSLVLLDEIGTGTDPAFGAALATATMEALSQDAVVVVTTHLDRIKAFAAGREDALNARVELDSETATPTYRLIFGEQGSSSAFEIAGRLGFPAALLEQARSRLSEPERQVEEYLQMLQSEIRECRAREERLERARQSLEEERLAVQRQQRALESNLRRAQEERLDELEQEFKKESSRLLGSIKDRFEAARLKKESARQQSRLKEAFRTRLRESSGSGKQEPVMQPDLTAGSRVWYPRLRRYGRILEVDRNEASVEIEGKKVRLGLDELEPWQQGLPGREDKPGIRLDVVQESEGELNLIGKRVEEALGLLDKFLDRAFVSGLREVKLVHGFGSGRLKAAVQEFLKTHPHVKTFVSEGGATRVTLAS